MSEELRLRAARRDDAYALFSWANDPATRSGSFDRPRIDWGSHVAWLERVLTAPDHLVLVAEATDGEPVGSVRFDTKDSWRNARLSYVVAPDWRGRGLSRPMLRAALALLSGSHAGAAVDANVRTTNVASLRVFRALGWRERAGSDGAARFRLE